jgi:hypothetical protein
MFEAGNVARWRFYSIFFQLCNPRQRPRKAMRINEEGEAPKRGRNNIQYLSPFNPSWPHDHWQAIQQALFDLFGWHCFFSVVHDYMWGERIKLSALSESFMA